MTIALQNTVIPPEEREKCGKTAKKPFITANRHKAAQFALWVPVSAATGMSANSGDELNLRHFHCARDNLSLHDHSDVQTVDELRHLHNRDIDHLHKLQLRDGSGHVNNLVQELHNATRRRPHPRTIREPTLGLPGAALDGCNVDQYRALGSAGAWVTLPKEVTPDGQVLRATTPEGVSPIIGLVSLHLQNPWLAPSFTSQLPHKGKELTGY